MSLLSLSNFDNFCARDLISEVKSWFPLTTFFSLPLDSIQVLSKRTLRIQSLTTLIIEDFLKGDMKIWLFQVLSAIIRSPVHLPTKEMWKRLTQ